MAVAGELVTVSCIATTDSEPVNYCSYSWTHRFPPISLSYLTRKLLVVADKSDDHFVLSRLPECPAIASQGHVTKRQQALFGGVKSAIFDVPVTEII